MSVLHNKGEPSVVQRTLAFDASVPFRIAYEDDSLIVVDKPAGPSSFAVLAEIGRAHV